MQMSIHVYIYITYIYTKFVNGNQTWQMGLSQNEHGNVRNVQAEPEGSVGDGVASAESAEKLQMKTWM